MTRSSACGSGRRPGSPGRSGRPSGGWHFAPPHGADGVRFPTTGFVRTSLAKLDDDDAKLLERLLREQAKALKAYPLDDADRRALAPSERSRRHHP